MKTCAFLLFFSLVTLVTVKGQTNTFPASGNAGIGTTSPGAKLSFNNVDDGSNLPDGITWYNPYPLQYGIYRTSGSWVSPNYQQLRINFVTGIILDPGASYGKSFVDIQGGGLRVTSGKVGIGTSSPNSLLHLLSESSMIQVQSSTAAGASELNLINNSGTAGASIGSYGSGYPGNYSYARANGASFHTTSGAAGAAGIAIAARNPSGYITLHTGGDTERVRIQANGNVGIGTASPLARLHVEDGDLLLQNQTSGYPRLWLKNVAGDNTLRLDYNSVIGGGDRLLIRSGGVHPLVLNDDGGFVGIGTSNPTEKLTVNGTIYGKEVKVDLSVPGPDYVFNKDYDLPSLDDVKAYIEQHGHLPEVPSAKEMEEKGISVGEMNMMLLKKVEEMTLYMIELKRETEAMKKKLKMSPPTKNRSKGHKKH